MKMRLATLVMLVSALVVILAPAATSAASPATGSLTFPISNVQITCTAAGSPSSLCTAAGQVLSFSGTGTVTKFSVVNGVLTATGTITGTLTNTVTGATQTISGTFSGAVNGGTGSCQILNLTIGPIYLNLLGLVVQTNTIHLTITAQQGPGNLLGNLLCAVANLLNGNASSTALQQLANLLNRIIAAL